MWCTQKQLDPGSALDYITAMRFSCLDLDGGTEELLLCGANDGSVHAVSFKALAAVQGDSAPETADADTAVAAFPAMRNVCDVDGCALGMDTLGSLLCVASEAGDVRVFVMDRLRTDDAVSAEIAEQQRRSQEGEGPLEAPEAGWPCVARIRHGCGVRAVCLWEGLPEWADDDSRPFEDAAAYVATACDDGAVRLWRVVIDCGQGTIPGPELLAVLAGQPSGEATSRGALMSLCFDVAGGNGDDFGPLPAASSVADEGPRVGTRLVATSSQGWWGAWDLASIPPPGAPASAFSSPTRDQWLGAAVFVPHTVTQLQKRLGGVWKAKHGTVATGQCVGMVSDYVHDADGVPTVTVLFDTLKKKVTWPADAVRLVQYPESHGSLLAAPIYTSVVLRSGRVAMGCADGSVSVLDWRHSERSYKVVQRVPAHTDLVKQLVLMRRPDILLSVGYDGLVREWHMYDEPVLLQCAATLLAPNAHPSVPTEPESAKVNTSAQLTTSDEDEAFIPAALRTHTAAEPVRFAIGAACTFPPARLLVTVPLFERQAATFVRTTVCGCDLPEDMAFDGRRTVRIPPMEGDDDPSRVSIPGVVHHAPAVEEVAAE